MSTGGTSSVPKATTMSSAIAHLKASNSTEQTKVALTTLNKIIVKIQQNPNVEKYRNIKASNAAFGRSVGGLTGGNECVLALGFKLIDGEYKLEATADAWNNLVNAKSIILKELYTLAFIPPPTTQPTPFTQPPPAAQPTPFNQRMPGFQPGMQTMLDQLLDNPEMMSMLQNNPMTSQYLTPQQQAMLNNPAMLQQLRQFMASNPNFIQDYQRSMQDVQMGRGFSFPPRPQQPPQTNTNPPLPQQTNTSQQSNTNQQQQGEEDMTEEEMIAEAIARSLRES